MLINYCAHSLMLLYGKQVQFKGEDDERRRGRPY